jgi:hypothetical protein
MFSKTLSKSAVSVLGIVFALSICIGLSGNIALAASHIPNECGNNSEFTTDFRLEDCKFKDKGENTYFILKPGHQSVLASDDEKVVITVLHDKKTIHLDGDGSKGKGKGRKIKTRVVEERESEWEDGEWVTKEISRNYFAICKQTNAVYYFGELSKDCTLGDDEVDPPIESTGGFDPTDDAKCLNGDDPDESGSWEAGIDGAMPGLIMPGTILLGAKYFQEQAPPDAVDRGQIEGMGLDWPLELDDGEDPDFTGCIKIVDTNPAEGDCDIEDEDADIKIYCPGVGLVQDEELELVLEDDDDDDCEQEGEHEGEC